VFNKLSGDRCYNFYINVPNDTILGTPLGHKRYNLGGLPGI
jgi:hypothetical protein